MMLIGIHCPACGYEFIVAINCGATATVNVGVVYFIRTGE